MAGPVPEVQPACRDPGAAGRLSGPRRWLPGSAGRLPDPGRLPGPAWRLSGPAGRLPDEGARRHASGLGGPGTCRRRAQGRVRRGPADPGRVQRPDGAGLRRPHLRGAGHADGRPAGRGFAHACPAPPSQPPPSGTNSMAIASMVLGVAEFFTAGLTAIPAVVCGHIARRQMKLTSQRGDGLATSGLVLGYMAIIFWSVLIAASLVGVAISIAHNGQVYPGPPSP